MVFGSLILPSVIQAQDSFQGVKDAYEQAVARFDLEKAMAEVKVETEFWEHLGKTLQKIKNSGKLSDYLQAEEFAKNLKAGVDVDPVHPSLIGLMKAYEEELGKVFLEFEGLEQKLVEQYTTKLEHLIGNLMRANRMDDAKIADDELSRVLKSKRPLFPVREVVPLNKRSKIPRDAVSFGGRHYLVMPQKSHWEAAQSACKKMGGHLVTIETDAENNFVSRLLNKGLYWTGYYKANRGVGSGALLRSETWVDINGKPLAYWKGQMPPKEKGLFRYSIKKSGEWFSINRRKDKKQLPYICEWEY
jgi:hypothetical protein